LFPAVSGSINNPLKSRVLAGFLFFKEHLPRIRPFGISGNHWRISLQRGIHANPQYAESHSVFSSRMSRALLYNTSRASEMRTCLT
jgi:hypothetical protein